MIWLIGSENLLGKEVAELLNEKDIPFVSSDSELNMNIYENLENFIKTKETELYYTSHRNLRNPTDGKIDWIINTSSFFSSEKNGKSALNVARISREHGAKLIHISDLACRDDEINSTITQYYIIKTSNIFGKTTDGFLSKIITEINSKNSIAAADFDENLFTSAKDLSLLILLIIEKARKATKLFGKNSALSYGEYIFTNKGKASSCNFLLYLCDELKKKKLLNNGCSISPSSSADAYSIKDFYLSEKELSSEADKDDENEKNELSVNQENTEKEDIENPLTDSTSQENEKNISSAHSLEFIEKELKIKNQDWKEALKKSL